MPLAWWVLSALFAASLLLAFGLSIGPVWGLASAAVSLAVTALLFLTAAVEIRVSDTELRVGRANVELRHLGEATPLNARQARERRGPRADARAFLVLRPYVSTAVEVELTDPDDPAPYWLVASRRPQAFAAALARANATPSG